MSPAADVTSAVGVRAEAVVDVAAIRDNTAALLAHARRTNPAVTLLAVVKADGYGHGAAAAARAAVAGGAGMLGVATPAEGVTLRAAGIEAPILAWLWVPDEDIAPAVAAGVTLGVSSIAHLDAVLAQAAGGPAVHLKIDTGLGRNGAGAADLEGLLVATAAAVSAGTVRLTGLMSHLANADLPDDPSVAEQIQRFATVLTAAEQAGLGRPTAHLANTPGTLRYPAATFDMVRCGIGIYGVDPLADGSPVPLRPAMTLRARISLTKRVPAGQGVSYGLTYRTGSATTLALVPLGYADGIPRSASNRAAVWCAGRRHRIAGRVAMDQFVLDIGDAPVRVGDPVIVFGPGDDGEPTANEFAAGCDTIGYEIVTRVGGRVPRRYRGTDSG